MTDASLYQELRGNLAALRMQAAAEVLPGALDLAHREHHSHTRFLKDLTDVEVAAVTERRRASLERFARLPAPWRIEDFDFDAQPAVDRALVNELMGLAFLEDATNVLLIGPPGRGKSYVACALAHAALRQGHTALYVRTPRLLEDLAWGRADGRYVRTLGSLARVSLLVLDDFLLTPTPVEACRDLLEVIEDRAERRATGVASQLPVDKWLAAMADPTLGEALLDRLCAASHRIAMKGPSQRKRQPGPVEEGATRHSLRRRATPGRREDTADTTATNRTWHCHQRSLRSHSAGTGGPFRWNARWGARWPR